MPKENYFTVTRDPAAIAARLRAYLFDPAGQPAPFLAGIQLKPGSEWNGVEAYWHIEGASPMAISTGPDGDSLFTLTSTDGVYEAGGMRAQIYTGSVRLSDIEFIEEVRR